MTADLRLSDLFITYQTNLSNNTKNLYMFTLYIQTDVIKDRIRQSNTKSHHHAQRENPRNYESVMGELHYYVLRRKNCCIL